MDAGDVLLFIDEIHTIIGAGSAEGSIDAAAILKPPLSRGEIQIIGATTLEEFRKHLEKDSALERRFQPLTINEPNEEQAVRIMEGLRDKYEACLLYTSSPRLRALPGRRGGSRGRRCEAASGIRSADGGELPAHRLREPRHG